MVQNEAQVAHSGEMPRTPRREEVPISIRVKPEVYDAIKAGAAEGRRSINRHVELLIDEALEARRRRQEGEGDTPAADDATR